LSTSIDGFNSNGLLRKKKEEKKGIDLSSCLGFDSHSSIQTPWSRGGRALGKKKEGKGIAVSGDHIYDPPLVSTSLEMNNRGKERGREDIEKGRRGGIICLYVFLRCLREAPSRREGRREKKEGGGTCRVSSYSNPLPFIAADGVGKGEKEAFKRKRAACVCPPSFHSSS